VSNIYEKLELSEGAFGQNLKVQKKGAKAAGVILRRRSI